MPASEARILANQQNAALSTGPRSAEGKEKSRQNALKHGLTGAGVALPNEDVVEVERRFVAFRDEMQATGEIGEALARRAAFLSVRLDRCVSHDTATLSERIRQADADFVAPEGSDDATAAQLRAEAKAIAMFDPSKEATLARRYEAATERGFFRALRELRQLNKQAPASQYTSEAEAIQESMGSFLQLKKQLKDVESESNELNQMPLPKPASRPEPAGFAPVGGHFDVPFTIGQRR
jgi:hypothetical protein